MSKSGTRFLDTAAHVVVPATSANLGPGFDCFGLALSRYDQVRARVIDEGLQLSFTGEGAANLPRDERHLILRSMRRTFAALGAQPSGLRVESVNNIPHGRGLGSSAAAIVAGILLARALTVGGEADLDDAEMLMLASEIEGHPDNVAACLLGGLTVAWTAQGRSRATQVPGSAVFPAVFIPAVESSTMSARAALPAQVPHADAAFNAARAALLILALTGRPELLLEATQERLHQSYRADAMPESAELMRQLRNAGIAAVISGAGSTVLALLSGAEQATRASTFAPVGWHFEELEVASAAAVTLD